MNNKIITESQKIAINHLEKGSHDLMTNKHYSFIIQDKEILGWGINRFGHVPLTYGYKQYSNIHSELVAYKKAKHRLNPNKSFKCLNIRLNNAGEYMQSSPCECCEAALRLLGCDTVVYSTAAGFVKVKI